jgi:hypothetical protein
MQTTIAEYATSTEIFKFQWKLPEKEDFSGILFHLKWMEGSLLNVLWHNKGDYFATLSKNTLGKTQVSIHSLNNFTGLDSLSFKIIIQHPIF